MDVQHGIWLVISSAVYLVPFLYLLNARLYINAFSNFFVFVFSSLHHLCDIGYCIVNHDSLEIMDYFFAYFSMGLILIYFIDVKSEKITVGLQTTYIAVVMFISVVNRLDIYLYLAVYSILFLMSTYHFIINYLNFLKKEQSLWKCLDNKCTGYLFSHRKYEIHPAKFIFFDIGLFLCMTALLFFYFASYMFWLLHSIWHIFSGLCQIPLYSFYDNRPLYQCFKKRRRLISLKSIIAT